MVPGKSACTICRKKQIL